MVRGKEVNTIVTPTSIAGEFCNGHEFHERRSQCNDVLKSLDGTVEGPIFREGPDVEFVYHRVIEIYATPLLVSPGEGCVVH